MGIHICPKTDILQCKQAQLSVAAKLCFSVCSCLDMDWKFLRLIPRLTQTQSGLATVGIGSASRGIQEQVNGNINRVPSHSSVPLLLHICCSQGVHFHTEVSERSDSISLLTTAISSNNWWTKYLILLQINAQYSST